MLTDCQTSLKNYPSILNLFDRSAISACAHDSIFLRQVLRQTVLIQLIVENFDDLMYEHFPLMKKMVEALYKNPESEAIVTKIKNELQTIREKLHLRYNLTTVPTANLATESASPAIESVDPTTDSVNPSTVSVDPTMTLKAIDEKRLSFDSEPYTHPITFPEHESLKNISNDLQNNPMGMDPIIFALTAMVIAYPSWTRRLFSQKVSIQYYVNFASLLYTEP